MALSRRAAHHIETEASASASAIAMTTLTTLSRVSYGIGVKPAILSRQIDQLGVGIIVFARPESRSLPARAGIAARALTPGAVPGSD